MPGATAYECAKKTPTFCPGEFTGGECVQDDRDCYAHLNADGLLVDCWEREWARLAALIDEGSV